VLVNEQDPDVLPTRQFVERFLDLFGFGFQVDDEEVAGWRCAGCNVADAS